MSGCFFSETRCTCQISLKSKKLLSTDGWTDGWTDVRTDVVRMDRHLRPTVLGRLGAVDLIIAAICCMYIVHGSSWWLQMYRIMPWSASDHPQRNFWRYVPVWSVQSRGMTELIPTIIMETRPPIEIYFGRQFLAICYHCIEFWRHEVTRIWKFLEKSLRSFGKTTPYDKIINIWFGKFTSRHRTLLCAKFVKIVRREIGEIVRCLPDKKTKFWLPLKLSLLRALCPKSAMVSPQNVAHEVPQISSISVHFRRSYSRPREGRSLGPLGKSNTCPKRYIALGK